MAGKSAYDVAVENGFVGSEIEWIASLIGPVGPAGTQGVPGIAGPAGPPAAGSESVEYCPARGRYLWVKDLCEAARDGSDSEIGHSGLARPRPLLGVVPRVKRQRLRTTRI